MRKPRSEDPHRREQKLIIAATKRSTAAKFHHLNSTAAYQDTIEANQDNIGFNDQTYCQSPTLTQYKFDVTT